MNKCIIIFFTLLSLRGFGQQNLGTSFHKEQLSIVIPNYLNRYSLNGKNNGYVGFFGRTQYSSSQELKGLGYKTMIGSIEKRYKSKKLSRYSGTKSRVDAFYGFSGLIDQADPIEKLGFNFRSNLLFYFNNNDDSYGLNFGFNIGLNQMNIETDKIFFLDPSEVALMDEYSFFTTEINTGISYFVDLPGPRGPRYLNTGFTLHVPLSSSNLTLVEGNQQYIFNRITQFHTFLNYNTNPQKIGPQEYFLFVSKTANIPPNLTFRMKQFFKNYSDDEVFSATIGLAFPLDNDVTYFRNSLAYLLELGFYIEATQRKIYQYQLSVFSETGAGTNNIRTRLGMDLGIKLSIIFDDDNFAK